MRNLGPCLSRGPSLSSVANGEDKALSLEKQKTAELVDITPPSEPIAVARDMVSEAPGCVAAVAVLVREDGTLWFDSCGHHRKDVLWALQRMILDLMLSDD